jgi:hypothetical protein
MKLHPEVVVPVFVGVWVTLGIAGLWFTYFDKNVARKKRLIPVFIVSAGAIFALFTFLMTGGDLGAMLLVVPAVVLSPFTCADPGTSARSRNDHGFGRNQLFGRPIWKQRAEYVDDSSRRVGSRARMIVQIRERHVRD